MESDDDPRLDLAITMRSYMEDVLQILIAAVDAPLRTLAAIRVSEPRHSSGDSEYYRVDMAFAEFDADRMHYRRRFRRQSVKE